MKLHTAIPLGEFSGQRLPNPYRGASDASRKCEPKGYGWVPKFPHRLTRAEKVALYRHKREIGRITDSAWAAICGDYPELTR